MMRDLLLLYLYDNFWIHFCPVALAWLLFLFDQFWSLNHGIIGSRKPFLGLRDAG